MPAIFFCFFQFAVTFRQLFRLSYVNYKNMNMKKRIITSVSVLLLALGNITLSFATNTQSIPSKVKCIIQKYDTYRGVEAIEIGPFLMKMAELSGEKEFKYCDRICILSAESDEVNARTMRALRRDTENALLHYTKIMEMNDEDEHVGIFAIQKNERYFTDLVIFATENDEISIVSIEGKIPVEEMNYLINKYND